MYLTSQLLIYMEMWGDHVWALRCVLGPHIKRFNVTDAKRGEATPVPRQGWLC